MARSNVLSLECPLCLTAAVERSGMSFSSKKPSHHCKKCGAALTTKHTKDALWCIPITSCALMLLVALLLYLRDSEAITGTLRAVLIGGGSAFVLSISSMSYLRGVVFHPWKEYSD